MDIKRDVYDDFRKGFLAKRKRELEAQFTRRAVAAVKRETPAAGYYLAAAQLIPVLWPGGQSPCTPDPEGKEVRYVAAVLAKHLPQCFSEREYTAALTDADEREAMVC